MAECKRSDGGGRGASPSSSMDSSTHPALSTTTSGCRPAIRRDLSTDLQLGLSLSPASSLLPLAAETKRIPSTPRNQVLPDWPPIKPFLRSALTASARRRRTMFVKVYMEGVPIGRKLDLLLLEGYDSLLAKLRHMFKTPITYADVMEYHQRIPREKAAHVLTYEDQDGDWMMVGDVPWELFLASVKKLRIARTDKC
ncbi:Auxin-responsive protein IAA4 [Dichanthelium oligosanthes]|uniref:Auxin-responsive protein n=1 Tax=Dichanthelium oligosanthes TaxID=888268 RepID=A0A1E5URK3_9POAL|nr:Auxin-responsive protein IAA4 [Dichanthelium oligosanthes]